DSLLKDDFDDADWDSKMAEIFNEEFYNEGEKEKLDVGEVEDDDDEEVEEVEEVEEDISTKSKRAQKKEEKVGKKKE
ncbi:hypothetical protein WICPIJ_002781, partial [Wickerhamomyces pijperi]